MNHPLLGLIGWDSKKDSKDISEVKVTDENTRL